ncbi:CAP domain-containing protein [Paracoccus rhizosphaerae]|uniref:CAP domain-containing protein n=1 Tax=Paracoccus rhizosphaerae TaxID=1133347 RepID=A0ABV6CK40_9RHOB|nr:CAP domain-containing protein [Paracoccus rhizosphaerae]
MSLKPLLALMLSCTAAAAQDPEALNQRALDLVNQARQDQGLETLTAGADLDEAARVHAEDMLDRNYYAHESPEGEDVRDRYLTAGGSEWELVAENIARCVGCDIPADIARVEAFQEGWMNSPGHRANILAEGLERFGFATASGGQTVYAVQTFAGPGTSRGDEPGQPVDAQAAAEIALDRINAIRQDEDLEPLQLEPSLQQTAAALVPEDLRSFALTDMGSLREALPEEARRDWQRIMTIGGTCGGCGTRPVAGDVETFVSDWLAAGSPYRDQILQQGLTHAGMVLRTDGKGRKVALLLLAETF